jgi:8-oxo-dGTP pyrophosphatase MutT (NUDIX family)
VVPVTEEWVLPPAMAERAARFATGAETPQSPRVAATVVLLRPEPAGDFPVYGGFQVHMIRRVVTMAFASGMYAFPGGSVDPRDAQGEPPDTAGDWADRLGQPATRAWAVVCAAIREVFEESGVRLTSDLLVPWSRWITPEFEPRRFDTYFFLAALPDGQHTPSAGDEFDDAIWVRPAEALERHAAGEIAMLPPTSVTLRELAAYSSIDGVLAEAGRDAATPVRPRVVFAPDGTARLLFPARPD